MLSYQDLFLFSIIIIVLFGSSKLPEIGKGLGEAIRGFKKAVSDSEPNSNKDKDETLKIEHKKQG
ncbi:twin-arginine translocase TatA/TatE family subunit [Thermodesulfovibrio yellowstonii]|uniref:Sec-independent protein translocase protein TatA n=1 Tax=Thermodesulfovibrio yellowstonii TaxID=28262 RepID=A0A9W6LJL6_9BACT|nr:twin-arginine translocase TatA/TatE family subunit [Thermodesulfovibrio islandicus]GLI52817.1 Sec-independent protein translocase protein TatA [Thermodesulfovibrio islandicus]